MDCEQEIEATEKQIAMARQLRHAFRRDGPRPAYHFLPPAAWMNDINGTLFW